MRPSCFPTLPPERWGLRDVIPSSHFWGKWKLMNLLFAPSTFAKLIPVLFHRFTCIIYVYNRNMQMCLAAFHMIQLI